MKKRILLTGSNGFLGKNITYFLGNYFDFIYINRDSKFNINKIDTLLEINKIDCVIHCAAETFIPSSFDDPFKFYKFNLNSTLNILEYCRIKKVSKFIYLNTYPYGVPKYNPIDEVHSLDPHSPYTKSKLISENLVFSYLDRYFEPTSLRIFNPYGQGQSNRFLIPTIVNQATASNIVEVLDDKPKRDFLYIEDLINLIKIIISSEDAKGIYNVGSGRSVSIGEICIQLQAILNKELTLVSKEKNRENEILDCYANIDKVCKKFDWVPKHDLSSGLRKYIDLLKKKTY